VQYLFEIKGYPWYKPFGYLPFYPKWNCQRLVDFYQLPFLKPREFLDLEYGTDLIHPQRITIQRYDHPVFLHCQKEPSSVRFRTLPATSFYHASKRPLNSMTNLRQTPFKMIDTSKVDPAIIRTGEPFKMGSDYFVPVTRYSMGMRQGCYFDPCPETKYLGTFYYWEPESNVYLNMGSKFQYFTSKIEATSYFKNLLLDYQCLEHSSGRRSDGSDRNNSLGNDGSGNDGSGQFVCKCNQAVEIYTTMDKFVHKIFDELIQAFYKNYEEEAMVFENKCMVLDDRDDLEDFLRDEFMRLFCGHTPRYIPIDTEYKSMLNGEYMSKLFYAAEDELDQSLAKSMLFLGYDVIFLGKMAGNYRIVSEVLDSRERNESLSNLYWTVI
jgi:hypothetical protein